MEKGERGRDKEKEIESERQMSQVFIATLSWVWGCFVDDQTWAKKEQEMSPHSTAKLC